MTMPLSHEQRRQRRAEMAAAVHAGKPVADVAREYGVRVETVKVAAKEARVSLTALSHEARAARRKAMADAVASGRLAGEVAVSFGVSATTVSEACREHGVKLARGRRPTTAPYRPAENWQGVDWSMQDNDIAQLVGVCRERVRQVRRRLGKPNARHHRKQKRSIQLRTWLKTHAADVANLTPGQIRLALPFGADNESVKRACGELGLEYAKPMRLDQLVTRDSLCSLVDVTASGCWEWQLTFSQNGYARVADKPAHHHVYRLFHGEIPAGLWVLHKCDNPKCVNPEHLYAGTAQDNANDRKRNRENYRSPLFDPEQNADIRRRRAAGESVMSIASDLKRSFVTIFNICAGKSYRGGKPGVAVGDPARDAEIARLYKSGELNQREIGERYGLTQSTVSRIVSEGESRETRTA
jgi:transposase